jgi:PAS domain S-box-containing protein
MKRNRVLVVDDNEDNRYFLCVLLQGYGYEVFTAAHGAEALEIARQNPPNLIISDILMPVMDGFSLCREWKKDAVMTRIPFIFYTATYTDERDRKFALDLGADRFVVKPEEPDTLMTIIRETVEKSQNNNPVAPHQLADETEYYREYNTALIRKLEDKMVQLEETNRILENDIAERKRTEEALRLAHGRIQRFVDANIIGIVVANAAGNIIEANDYFLRMIGFTREELEKGQIDWMTITPPEWRSTDEQAIRNLRERGVCTPYEKEYILRDGDHIPVFLALAMLPGSEEQIAAFALDLTELKQAQAKMAKLEIQLQQAQKMELVGRLAGGVAHDFNNMLEVIIGHTEMALGQVDSSLPLHADLAEIFKAASRSADLTRQLLAFARKQTVAPKVLDLNETVAGMLKMLHRLIGEHINLNWRPTTDLWPVKVDPSQIDQILANLCVNSRDAISGVGNINIETGNITIGENDCTAHAEFIPGEYVLLAVSDDGCGMNKETLGHLFEPFFTTKEKGKGTGLGLATVYGIVKQNNGFIDISSVPDQGTTFMIYLPRDKGKAEQMRAENVVKPPKIGRETILLAEDEQAILELITRMLELQGYTVLAASTPGEAICLAREHAGEIHLLMTDVVMPEMNGRDLAKNLLSYNPSLKRLFMSGYTANVIAHNCVLDEGVFFIQKPFTVKDLTAKVREALDSK